MKYKDIKTPFDLYDYMKDNIKYGFVNQNKEKLFRKTTPEIYYMDEIFRNYYFQSPEELLKSKCGICFDQNKLIKYWLKNNNYIVNTYYTTIRNHTIVVYYYNNEYYWFERTFDDYKGIHVFDSLDKLFYYYIYVEDSLDSNVEIYEYDNIPYGVDLYDFINIAKTKGNLVKKIVKK